MYGQPPSPPPPPNVPPTQYTPPSAPMPSGPAIPPPIPPGPQYAPPQYAPPPGVYGAPPPAPATPKKSTLPLILGIAGAVVLLMCGGVVACVAVLGNSVDANGTGTGSGAGGGTVGLNQPARDGDLEFTVSKVECGKSEVGDEPIVAKAQGQFCLVSMSVKNIGKESVDLLTSQQTAFNPANAKYKVDDTATFYIAESSSFVVTINPGNTVDAILVYDIPKDQSIAKLELHDSFLSGGVTIKVT